VDYSVGGGHMDGGRVDYSVSGWAYGRRKSGFIVWVDGHMDGGRVNYSVGGWAYGRRKSRLLCGWIGMWTEEEFIGRLVG
jgi:hypothetical protein